MNDDLWQAATEHEFLRGVRDGTLSHVAFDRWLVQDVHFVADLLNFQALLLARSPRPAQRVLAAGCLALVDELAWFDTMAAQLDVELHEPRSWATDDYAGLLDRLDAEPFDAAITALWTIEQVYLDAWTFAAGDGPFIAFAEHWSTPDFAAYVDALRELALPDDYPNTVADVLRCEIAFWDDALS